MTDPAEDPTAWTVDLSGISDALAEVAEQASRIVSDAFDSSGVTDLTSGIVPSFDGLTEEDAYNLAMALFGDDEPEELSQAATTWVNDILSNVADAVGAPSTLERLGIDPSKPRSKPETRDRLLHPAREGHRPSSLDLAAIYASAANFAPCSLAASAAASSTASLATASLASAACVSTGGLLLDAIAVNLDRGIARDRNKRATERALTGPLQLSYKLDAPSHHRRHCSEHRPSPLDLLPIHAHAPPLESGRHPRTSVRVLDRPIADGLTMSRDSTTEAIAS